MYSRLEEWTQLAPCFQLIWLFLFLFFFFFLSIVLFWEIDESSQLIIIKKKKTFYFRWKKELKLCPNILSERDLNLNFPYKRDSSILMNYKIIDCTNIYLRGKID